MAKSSVKRFKHSQYVARKRTKRKMKMIGKRKVWREYRQAIRRRKHKQFKARQ